MPSQASRRVEPSSLEAALKALSSENRLELLRALREPRTVDEIHLTPSPARAGEQPDRPLTRQAVRHHLDRLEAVGLVRVGERRGDDGRWRREYVLDVARLFGVLEGLKDLAPPAAAVPLAPLDTEPMERQEEAFWIEGPKLVLVHGAREGRVFPLRPRGTNGGRGWVLGRSPEADISLPYDPFLSAENSEIVARESGFHVLDLRTSTNGTLVNGRSLPVGGEHTLDHGDILRVGASVLVFHDA